MKAVWLSLLVLLLTACTAQYVDSPDGSPPGRDMTVADIRALAQKGDELVFADLAEFRGGNVSSDFNYYIMVYGVEGGYRLVVHSQAEGAPDIVALENIWESGGSGIDIRYGDLSEFFNKWPIVMRLKAETITPRGAVVTLQNFTDNNYTYGSDFRLQRVDIGVWPNVETVPEIYFFTSEGYTLAAQGSVEIAIDWQWLYGELPPGDYRLVKEAIFDKHSGGHDTHTLYAAFSIGE